MTLNLKQRLAFTTGTLSASVLLAPMSAQGNIIHFDSSNKFTVLLGSNGTTEWDVDGDGNDDFALKAYQTAFSSVSYRTIDLTSGGLAGRGLVQAATTGVQGFQFNALASSLLVGPTLANGYQFGDSNQTLRSVVYGSTFAGSVYGPYIGVAFPNGQEDSNFIGFRFDIAGDIHYGWAELIVEPSTFDVTINQWAYEDQAGQCIHVAATSGTAENCPSVPNPGTLSLLALGAAGIRRWRGQAAATGRPIPDHP